jgi:cytoskeletal protein RodZ
LELTELSNKLKETRLSLGLSMDDLQATTKIQKRYLQAIEEGNYSIIPGPFYVRAFIKQYAEAVQLDPDEIFEEYKADIPSTHSEDFPEKLSRVQTRKDVAPSNSKILAILPRLLIGVFVIGAVALAYFLVLNFKDREAAEEPATKDNEQIQYEDNLTEQEAEEETETEATEEDDKQTSGANNVTEDTTEEEATPTQEVAVAESKGKETVYELKNAEKFEVKLVSTGETWVNMLNGKGESFWQGILKKGAEENKLIDYSKEQEAVLVIGNSTQTEIYVNDQKLEYATPPADQVRQDITIRFVPAVNE